MDDELKEHKYDNSFDPHQRRIPQRTEKFKNFLCVNLRFMIMLLRFEGKSFLFVNINLIGS